MDLPAARRYFEARAGEIRSHCGSGSAFVFIEECVLLEYLASAEAGKAATAATYKAFVSNWLGRVRPAYRDFAFRDGQQNLPAQMYYVLRCGLVHSFSLTPDAKGQSAGGRDRSIVLSHRSDGRRHLTRYPKRAKAPDAVLFVAEDFADDLRSVVRILFDEAKRDGMLRGRILGRMRDHEPLAVVTRRNRRRSMPTVIQEVMIGEELLVAMGLLKVGLRELGRIDGATDFFHLPILLLASGFERMMKTVICCHHLETTGQFPPPSEFKRDRRGHDLTELLQRITQDCYSDAYLSRVPAAQADIAFLRSDPRLAAILKILSDFGQSARYYNLNIVLGHEDPGPSPEDEWQKLELEILKEDASWASRIGDPRESDAIHREINTALTVQCETLARALSRLFTIGGLGPLGRRISAHTHHFLFLTDDQLGKTDYEHVRV